MHKTAIAVTLLLAGIGTVAAQSKVGTDFPNRPIRIVVGFTPGGQPDIFSRLIAPRLGEALGQTVVVDNRPGAGSAIGTKIVADATPDGHTLLCVSASHVISPAVRKLNFDPVRDFSAITQMYNASYLLVAAPGLGVKNVKDLIAMAKARPGVLNFSSAGTGSGTHFAGEVFKDAAKIDIVHVPYKGIPEAMNDTMTNRVQVFMAPLASSAGLVRDGRLVALGVTSLKRVSIYPEIPTIAESGLPGFAFDSWGGLLAPSKVPRAIITRLNREVTAALNHPEIQQRMRSQGAEPSPTTPEAFDKQIARELKLIGDIAKRAGINPQ
ncbi:MAG: tripartite tricarboxylate transporter substrate binding protein [Burkholderiales bacterium]|jgi:tripartite-type tricarboxylate transporter receptor subunit TctC|nr:tripartite tricarboxylate transporter substrate binding protein [Burkholderiales bacterium]